MKTKLKAFTLAEMIVVLIITSIVIGLAFTILNLVQKHMNIVQNNLRQNTQTHLLKEVLEIDFSSYPNISLNAKEKRLLFASPMDSVTYYFNDKIIIRDRDTFNMKSLAKNFYFQGIVQQSGPVDAIKLTFKKANQNIFVFKQNDASKLMN